jgi:hypothetical protein
MMLALARVPLARLTRTRRGWLPIVGWAALAIVAAASSGSSGHPSGADHVMRGMFGFAVIPLLTYGIVSASLGGTGLRPAVRGLVALGAPPSRAALVSVLLTMLASSVVCAVLAALVSGIAHGPSDAPLASDLPATFGVAFIAGAAYAAYFCAGSAIGRGAMRGVFLVFDWLLGVPAGFGALFTPRGHVTSLLGGPMCFDLSRRASSVILFVLLLGYLAIAVRLGRRVR